MKRNSLPAPASPAGAPSDGAVVRAAILRAALAVALAEQLRTRLGTSPALTMWAARLRIVAETLAEDVLAPLATGLPPPLAAFVAEIATPPANDLDAAGVMGALARLAENLRAARELLAVWDGDAGRAPAAHLAWCAARVEATVEDLAAVALLDLLGRTVVCATTQRVCPTEAPCAT